MLHLTFADPREIKTDLRLTKFPSSIFDYEYDKEWFEDPFFLPVLRDIEQLDVHPGSVVIDILSSDLRLIDISNGTKMLFMIKYIPDILPILAKLGDNCLPYLLDLAEEQEIYMCANIMFEIDRNGMEGHTIHITNTDRYVTSYEEMVQCNIDMWMSVLSKIC